MSGKGQYGLYDFLETYHYTFDYDVGQVACCTQTLTLLTAG